MLSQSLGIGLSVKFEGRPGGGGGGGVLVDVIMGVVACSVVLLSVGIPVGIPCFLDNSQLLTFSAEPGDGVCLLCCEPLFVG